VEVLCTACRITIILRGLWPKRGRSPGCGAASHGVSLARLVRVTTIIERVGEKSRGVRSDVNAITFTETIHGRTYVIVTSPVGPDRWRAEVARTPGVTTSLMPFYGPTPDAAAGQLAVWLERAGNRSRTRPGV
jgi:hypothetical protein